MVFIHASVENGYSLTASAVAVKAAATETHQWNALSQSGFCDFVLFDGGDFHHLGELIQLGFCDLQPHERYGAEKFGLAVCSGELRYLSKHRPLCNGDF